MTGTDIKALFQKKDVSSIAGTLGAGFYQCWGEIEGDMWKTLEEIYKGMPGNLRDADLNGLSEIFSALDEIKEVELIYRKLGFNYNPREDGIANIEWLVWVKLMLSSESDQEFSEIQSILKRRITRIRKSDGYAAD